LLSALAVPHVAIAYRRSLVVSNPQQGRCFYAYLKEEIVREVKRVLRRLFRQAPATFTLCAANVVVYLLTAVQSLSFLHNLDESSLAQHWVLYLPDMVDSIVGPLRAVGATFLHDGPAHLLFNIVMIYLLGREVEKKIGHALFSTVYFAGGVSGSALSVWLDPQHAVVGASGSAYALMAVFAGLAAKRRGSTDLRGAITLILVNLGFSVLSPGVSLAGHAGGLTAGIVMAVVLTIARTMLMRWGGVLAVFGSVVGALMTRVIEFADQFSTGGLWNSLH